MQFIMANIVEMFILHILVIGNIYIAMKTRLTITALPESAQQALKALGDNVRTMRKLQGMSMATLAQRAFTTREALRRLENGQGTVSLGLLAHVLWVLGQEKGLASIAAAHADVFLQARLQNSLKQRIHDRDESDYDF